jgi:serine/threonine protein kinase
MTIALTMRLSAIGGVLAARMPNVLDAVIALLESILPAFDPAPPERYDIKHQLGTGGMADVLLGTFRGAEGFHRPVAIKRARSDSADAATFAARLIEEADLAARLSHPNVGSVLDLDRDKSGRLFLVMEHVGGVNLGALIETGPLPYPVAIFIVRELLSGLGYIHEHRGRGRARGLIHRDVTPHNVLLSWEGEVKLADFGLALPLEGARTGVDMAGGTPGYMSPEQANRQALDGRSDLYAVGIVLWEILALRRLRVGAPGDLSARIVSRTSRARASTGKTSPPISRLSPCGSSPTTGRSATGRPSSPRTTSCAARTSLGTDGGISSASSTNASRDLAGDVRAR